MVALVCWGIRGLVFLVVSGVGVFAVADLRFSYYFLLYGVCYLISFASVSPSEFLVGLRSMNNMGEY